jgi:hypothetical protein
MCRNALFFIFIFPMLPACRCQPTAPDTTNVDVNTQIAQWAGQHSGRETAANEVLRTPEEWDAFWKKVGGNRPRPLNVSREMAVAIQLGGRRTGGFSVEVLRTQVQEGKLIVEYRETAPEPGMMVTQELTEPWIVAIIPRSDLPVVFRNTGSRRPAARDK